MTGGLADRIFMRGVAGCSRCERLETAGFDARPIRLSSGSGGTLEQHYTLPAAFLIRYDDIDAQHVSIVSKLNELNGRVDIRVNEDTQRLMDDLLASMRNHFAHEEKLMEDTCYPRCEEHRRHHQQCLADVDAILQGASRRTSLSRGDLDGIFNVVLNVVARADLYFEEFLIGAGLLPDGPKPV